MVAGAFFPNGAARDTGKRERRECVRFDKRACGEPRQDGIRSRVTLASMGDPVMATVRTVELVPHEHACNQLRETALKAILGNIVLAL
jgi:hypothetical protein